MAFSQVWSGGHHQVVNNSQIGALFLGLDGKKSQICGAFIRNGQNLRFRVTSWCNNRNDEDSYL
jgi:hypothetical protein